MLHVTILSQKGETLPSPEPEGSDSSHVDFARLASSALHVEGAMRSLWLVTRHLFAGRLQVPVRYAPHLSLDVGHSCCGHRRYLIPICTFNVQQMPSSVARLDVSGERAQGVVLGGVVHALQTAPPEGPVFVGVASQLEVAQSLVGQRAAAEVQRVFRARRFSLWYLRAAVRRARSIGSSVRKHAGSLLQQVVFYS